MPVDGNPEGHAVPDRSVAILASRAGKQLYGEGRARTYSSQVESHFRK